MRAKYLFPLLIWAVLLCPVPSFAQDKPADSTALKKTAAPIVVDSTKEKSLKKENRNFFERLFGAKKEEPKKDTTAKVQTPDEITRAGKAINNPERSPKAINDKVYMYLEALHHCYLRRLQITPALRGDLQITFTIKWDGKVEDVVVLHSTLDDKDMEKCVLGRLKMWKFNAINKDEGDVTVTYPFRFTP
jgi:TonB family protein